MLNYDLMKADNNSLTKEDKEMLKKETYNIFIEQSHKDFIKAMVAVANPENLKQTLLGLQSIPISYGGERGFEITLSNNNGTWHTPWLGEEFQKNYYKENKYYNLILEFPQEFPDPMEGGSLVIQLEMDTRYEEGWQEEVVYWEGSKYKLYTDEYKNWSDAASHCQGEGGHLASVMSDGEQEEVRAAAGGQDLVWLGGSDVEEEGVWRWADGSPWGYSNWQERSGSRGDDRNCVYMYSGYDHHWSESSCTDTIPFLCQLPTAGVLSGNRTVTLEYRREELTFTSINVLYHYRFNHELLDSWKNRRMTGFRLSWFLQDNNGSRLDDNRKPHTSLPQEELVRMV